ncbi:tetratricopeptide repeat protein [Umezawaea sp. Da 62-37]|uniref:ATP-binding protein n=1 Tax=Umezawaea sp. Da 62-37 TaxID=3075927 RepID=UPI0028F717A0|nr:tetratricopeptide repeat protein [Umezawaea sp. Da 62-37]WNV83207.1 tetratricopeptide repeat protein [Umezawaea sp. Da 62-37]
MTGTHNEVSGTVFGPVVQAEHIGTLALPAPQPLAVTGLPPARPLSGREVECDRLAALLDPVVVEGHVVVLSGLGGVGKTALVLRVARDAVDRGRFPGGVLFVDLQGYDPARTKTPETVLNAFVRMLGVRGEHLPPDPGPLYRSLLAEREDMLIVVDNASSSDQVRPLLPGVDRHRVVVTSRNQLADLGVLLDLGVLNENAALDMIGERSDEARELARLCGYLPLALTIVGALLSVEPRCPIGRLVEDLADARYRLDELSFSGSVDIRAAFDLSFAKLDPDQRSVFSQLSIHPGPDLGLGVAAAVAGLSERQVRRLVDSLVRASLLQTDGTRRYGFHDLVRLYAVEKAIDVGGVTGRIVEHYRSRVGSADRIIRPTGPQIESSEFFDGRTEAMAWFDAECENLIACVSLAHTAGLHTGACVISHHMFSYLDLRARMADWIAINQVALASAGHLHNRRITMGVLSDLGVAYRSAGRLDDAIHCYERIIEVGDGEENGGYLVNLATIHYEREEFSLAVRHYRKSLALLRIEGDVHGAGQVLNNLGLCYMAMERYTAAVDCLAEALDIRRVVRDLHGEGQTLNNLGAALVKEGRLEEGADHLERGLEIKREVGDLRGICTSLLNLGNAHRARKDLESARRCWEEAISALEGLDEQDSLDHLRGLLVELDASPA